MSGSPQTPSRAELIEHRHAGVLALGLVHLIPWVLGVTDHFHCVEPAEALLREGRE
jgi:hypothetical protein